GAREELEQAAEVEEVGLVVLRLGAATVHHEHLEVGDGRRVGRDRACPTGDREERGGEDSGGPRRPAERSRCQRRSIHHGGVARRSRSRAFRRSEASVEKALGSAGAVVPPAASSAVSPVASFRLASSSGGATGASRATEAASSPSASMFE